MQRGKNHTHRNLAVTVSLLITLLCNNLLSNVRPTTRVCVHLVRRGYFRSSDRDGGHNIRSAVIENPMLHANLMAPCFIEPELWSLEVLHCGSRDFRPFLLLWLRPWPDDLHIRIWLVIPGDISDMHIWTYIKAFESFRLTERQTDTTEIIYDAVSRVVSTQ